MEKTTADATNWTEAVEDLVNGGELEKAVNLLETIVSKLEIDSKPNELSAALLDLTKLYASQGLSLKADEARARALVLKQHSLLITQGKRFIFRDVDNANTCYRGKAISEESNFEASSNLHGDGSQNGGSSDDDWEALVDRDPNELLAPSSLPEVSNLSLHDTKGQAPKRRGRGTFLYKKHALYSDQQSGGPIVDDDVASDSGEEGTNTMINLKYGSHHVLVLADFPPSTRTTDLEKLLQKHKDQVVIRWVNDTVALAVFRTPSLAQEAIKSIDWPYSMRILNEDDEILSQIPPRDLEPPRQRPQTSARTAQRLIAQSMGIRVPSGFGARELRKQEEERKSRIISRQSMKEDAWGDDIN
ncbi:unnamed protein product [Cuscuta epithymum]|uniref:Coiled-coil domain-containing protein R3HCC1L n=1 Tax=Cuscuta epithymum TaxID=186058 RepID=A0AAV0FC28_9ASTE|nr:unnamed protein product [Cuscuta epithymum]